MDVVSIWFWFNSAKDSKRFHMEIEPSDQPAQAHSLFVKSRNGRKRTFRDVRQAKIQIRLRIRAVWSESSLDSFWIGNDTKFLHVDNEDSDETVLMRRLIWVIVGRNVHYENTPIPIYRKIHLQKTENVQMKNSDIYHISAQNIDCGYPLEPPRRGGSNEHPQSMFLSINK